MNLCRPRLTLLVLVVLAFAVPMPATAQDYPNRPIRFIVPYPPGGGTDIVARILTEPLAAALGQSIIVDYRGSAAGNVGTDIAAKAPADGYNVLFTLSSHTINPKLSDKLLFDVERDFVPVSLVAMIPQVREKLLLQGAEAAPSTSAEFDRVIKDELQKWEFVIRAASIKPE